MRRLTLLILVLTGGLALVLIGLPRMAAHAYGPPAPELTTLEVVEYSARLIWDDGLLTRPLVPKAPDLEFEVQHGESIGSICDRLEKAGIILDASMMRDYLVYTGLDTSVQAGQYRVSAGMSIVDIARKMQDATPTEVTLVVLPGWRIEEIAASLPTSGLAITPEEFAGAASSARSGYAFLEAASTTEGFLYPDSYVLPRATQTGELVEALIRNFALHLSPGMEEGFGRQGLSTYQAVTLASIVQREAVRMEEAPMIASVFLNRLKTGMRLDADPTVQYALGYNVGQGTWWTNPLSLGDFQLDSPYNTYLYGGLPPAPIANPGQAALEAVASPADSPYYYFSARCDGSGYHNFAQTLDEHRQNLCP